MKLAALRSCGIFIVVHPSTKIGATQSRLASADKLGRYLTPVLIAFPAWSAKLHSCFPLSPRWQAHQISLARAPLLHALSAVTPAVATVPSYIAAFLHLLWSYVCLVTHLN